MIIRIRSLKVPTIGMLPFLATASPPGPLNSAVVAGAPLPCNCSAAGQAGRQLPTPVLQDPEAQMLSTRTDNANSGNRPGRSILWIKQYQVSHGMPYLARTLQTEGHRAGGELRRRLVVGCHRVASPLDVVTLSWPDPMGASDGQNLGEPFRVVGGPAVATGCTADHALCVVVARLGRRAGTRS